ncbi:zinc finger CCCH domain-containing protein 44-like [Cornus florida]|uniref:zinc finger CCCH domain-containing protein 44-like n=1 Tax=Cornus florida TaxID=4283 RepID=UPI00289B4DA1|nr:zinc finger CCCH domain-containing protein 44-like [Cornus florida]
MEDHNSASPHCTTHMEAQNPISDEALHESIHEMDDSQIVGAPVIVAGDGDGPSAAKAEGDARGRGGKKRRRTLLPRVQARRPPPPRKKKEEEDVCFICFDGGSLVLCDRRGCPKAYHTTCIKRDEAFFRSKARWNCGWHICSSCQKAAHYMCYTCTYSLCKGCTKDADYVCIRGNKGFCTTCMRTILLIENNEQGNKETAQVDFDDKSSWEYLFKVYWIYLKEKLSLTSNELIRAKNPWKGAGTMAFKRQSSNLHCGGKGSALDNSSVRKETNGSKRRKIKEHPEFLKKDTLSMGKLDSDKGIIMIGCTEWASKELLEFVAHMKNGDTSVLTQFAVQALLLEYIKKNNLRDPCCESQIICDSRLSNLFKKSCVDYFEMLKLLELHFHIKEDFPNEASKPIIQESIDDAVARQVDADSNNGNILMMGKDMKCRPRKEGEEKGPQISVDKYATIDVHTVNLIYVRRNLMETLIEDNEKFHDKVVDSIVRVRISNSDQKQDMHRLVQVVGTSKVAVPYKLGERTADVMLEILNLDKKETVSIDAISNEEFSEDECRYLQHNIKCGLVKWFTVGDIQEKAMALLQAVRHNDWLEKEILRSNHLRVKESEKGHKKEIRECIEKLQLPPEEPQRRLHEIPQVHADPNYEFEEDAGELNAKKKDECVISYSGFGRKGRGSVSPRKGGDISNDIGGKAWKVSMTCGQSRNTCNSIYPDKESHPLDARKDSCGSNSLEKPGDQVDSAGSAFGDRYSQAVLRSGSFSGVASGISTAPLSTGMAPSLNKSEKDKLWHYRDPNGKIQEPVSMVQLREWRMSENFPPGMRISGVNDKQDVSLYSCDGRWGGSMNTVIIDSKQSEGSCNSNNAKSHSSDINETMSITCCSHLQAGNSSQCCDSSECNNPSSDLPQVHSQLFPSTLSGRLHGNLTHQGRDLEGKRWNSGPNNWNSHGTAVFKTMGVHSHENKCNSWGHPGQSSGQNWKPLPVNFSSTHQNSSSNLAYVTKSTDSSEQHREIGFVKLPCCTQKPSNGNWESQAADNKQSVSSNAPDQESRIQDLPNATEKSSIGNEKGRVTINKQSVSSNFLDQDSGPSWSSASSLVAGSGTQLPETADEWDGYSATPAKSSVEELDSSVVSVTSLKPPEVFGDHAATPTSKIEQLAYSPPSSWQAIDAEPIEISTLAEESVSDLLAEVDAMESQYGLTSPTSKLNCGGELMQNSKDDCFNSIEVSSPTHNPGKSNAFSSTSGIQLPSQSTMTDEKLGSSRDDILDPVKRSGGHSSTSAQGEGETWFGDVPVMHCNAGSNIQPLAPSTMKHNILDSDTTQTAGLEATDTGWGTMKINVDLGWRGSDQGITKMDWATGLETPRGNAIMDWIASPGSVGWENQRKSSDMRFTGPGDGAL